MSSAFRVARFYKAVGVAIALSCLCVVMFFVYVHSEKLIDRENERLVQAIQLGDELRQSSDDLTRMARSYVVTGNELFREHYFEIIEIRDGQRPRPVDYQDVYWDLVMDDDKRPRPMDTPLAIVEQVRRIGLTPAEMVLLTTAKAYPTSW